MRSVARAFSTRNSAGSTKQGEDPVSASASEGRVTRGTPWKALCRAARARLSARPSGMSDTRRSPCSARRDAAASAPTVFERLSDDLLPAVAELVPSEDLLPTLHLLRLRAPRPVRPCRGRMREGLRLFWTLFRYTTHRTKRMSMSWNMPQTDRHLRTYTKFADAKGVAPTSPNTYDMPQHNIPSFGTTLASHSRACILLDATPHFPLVAAEATHGAVHYTKSPCPRLSVASITYKVHEPEISSTSSVTSHSFQGNGFELPEIDDAIAVRVERLDRPVQVRIGGLQPSGLERGLQLTKVERLASIGIKLFEDDLKVLVNGLRNTVHQLLGLLACPLLELPGVIDYSLLLEIGTPLFVLFGLVVLSDQFEYSLLRILLVVLLCARLGGGHRVSMVASCRAVRRWMEVLPFDGTLHAGKSSFRIGNAISLVHLNGEKNRNH